MTETKQVPVEVLREWVELLDPDFVIAQQANHRIRYLRNKVLAVIDAAAPAIGPRYDLLEAANRLDALADDLAHQGDDERAHTAADIAAEVRVHAEATEPSEVERLAVEIADEAAIQSIACECSHHYMDDGVTWADTSYASDNDVDLGPDLRYLDLRGLLEHHPDHPKWVRVKGEKS